MLAGVLIFIGSIIGIITGFLYFGLGGAILGFFLAVFAMIFIAHVLSEYGEVLWLLLQIAIICILILLLWGKCAPMSLFKSDHNDEKNKINPTDQKPHNQDTKPKDSVKTDTPTPDSFKESVKKFNDTLRNKDVTQKGEADNQINNNSSKSEELLDKLTSKNTVDMKQELKNDIDLSSIDYPSSFLTKSDSQFLTADGKEAVIPASTRITILKRTPAGMLTLEAGGKTYLGYESRLSGNIKKQGDEPSSLHPKSPEAASKDFDRPTLERQLRQIDAAISNNEANLKKAWDTIHSLTNHGSKPIEKYSRDHSIYLSARGIRIDCEARLPILKAQKREIENLLNSKAK